MRYIAIDLGSSFIKHGVFDLEGRTIQKKGRTPSPPRLASEDPKRFMLNADSLCLAVEAIIDEYIGSGLPIEGLVLSTQMHGFIVSHPDFGPAAYVSWQDTRCLEERPEGGSHLDHLKALIPPEYMIEAGVPLKPMLGLSNLYTFMREAAHGASAKPELFTLGSYILCRLTGRNITHITNAAPLGLVDMRSGTWHPGILEAAGLTDLKLPEIANDFESVGTLRRKGLELAVFPDIGDQQATVLGCGVGPGDMVINVGTAAQIAYIASRLTFGNYETRPFFEGLYLNTVSRMPGGRNIDVLVSFIQGIGKEIYGLDGGQASVWDYFNNSYRLEDSQGLKVDSAFYDMPHKLAGGSIGNIGPANLTLRNLFSATLQDMARVYHRYILALCGNLDKDIRLVFSGGVSWNNPMLLKAVAEETGLPVELSPMKDEVFSGLFRLALIGAKLCPGVQEAAKIQIM